MLDGKRTRASLHMETVECEMHNSRADLQKDTQNGGYTEDAMMLVKTAQSLIVSRLAWFFLPRNVYDLAPLVRMRAMASQSQATWTPPASWEGLAAWTVWRCWRLGGDRYDDTTVE